MRITFDLEDEVVRGINESIVAEGGELSDHMATLAEYLLRQVYLRTAAERELDTDEVLDLDEIRENLAIMAQTPSHAHPRAKNWRGTPVSQSYDGQTWEPFALAEPEELLRRLHAWQMMHTKSSYVYVKRLLGDRMETWMWLFQPAETLQLPVPTEEGGLIIFDHVLMEGRVSGATSGTEEGA